MFAKIDYFQKSYINFAINYKEAKQFIIEKF